MCISSQFHFPPTLYYHVPAWLRYIVYNYMWNRVSSPIAGNTTKLNCGSGTLYPLLTSLSSLIRVHVLVSHGSCTNNEILCLDVVSYQVNIVRKIVDNIATNNWRWWIDEYSHGLNESMWRSVGGEQTLWWQSDGPMNHDRERLFHTRHLSALSTATRLLDCAR